MPGIAAASRPLRSDRDYFVQNPDAWEARASPMATRFPHWAFVAEVPSSRLRRNQLITELGLSSRKAATSCREAPPSAIVY
jgi:hypothetical protein